MTAISKQLEGHFRGELFNHALGNFLERTDELHNYSGSRERMCKLCFTFTPWKKYYDLTQFLRNKEGRI